MTCAYDGQIHTLLANDTLHAEPFQIKCPNLAQVCPELICPDNCSGRGECVYDRQTSTGFCRCFQQNDTSKGCYDTSLEFIYSEIGFQAAPANRVDVYALLIIILGIIGLLWMIHITSRVCEENQRRLEPEPSAQRHDQNDDDDDDKTTFQKTFGRKKVRRKRHRDFRKDTEGESVWGTRRQSSNSREERRSMQNPFL
jgi:hypothetical protein